jgi:hypothetical protein
VAVAIVSHFLAGILAPILSLVSAGLRELSLLPPPAAAEIPTPTPTTQSAAPAIVGQSLTALIMLALIGLIALALVRAYSRATFAARASQRSRTTAEEEKEPGLGRRVLERLGLFRQWRAAASVRRTYRQMCRMAAAAGYPRLESETPYEYLPVLGRVWPEYPAESRLITEAYVRVRYGEAPETAEELEAIREAWRRLEQTTPQPRQPTTTAGPSLAKRE